MATKEEIKLSTGRAKRAIRLEYAPDDPYEFYCEGCDRPELDCSKDPCDAVIRDQES